MKIIAPILLLFTSVLMASGQDLDSETPGKKSWLIPDHMKVQFAGNIGFLSVGAGYLHGNDKLETDLYAGFLPRSIGGDHIISLTTKMTYSPWKFAINEEYTVIPFSIGPYLSYSFGSQFDTLLPNEYPKGYYWWATSLRFGAFVGGRVQMDLGAQQRVKSFDFYYELGTYDLEFLSYMQNQKSLQISDIFSLALGVKLRLH